MDWANWQIRGGEDVGQSVHGLNFSDSSLLLEAVINGLGVGLVSQLLSSHAQKNGQLMPLAKQSIATTNWSWLIHHDS